MNQRFPSGPAVMPSGSLMPVSLTFEITPSAVMRPMVLLITLVNQRLPSGPEAIAVGLSTLGSEKLLMVPVGVTRPILFEKDEVYQTLPSGPAAIPAGASDPVPKVVTVPSGVTRSIWK